MKTIILSYSTTAKSWVAETLVDGQPCPESLDLFGTHILPTAYTSGATNREVLAGIMELNPLAFVRLADDKKLEACWDDDAKNNAAANELGAALD